MQSPDSPIAAQAAVMAGEEGRQRGALAAGIALFIVLLGAVALVDHEDLRKMAGAVRQLPPALALSAAVHFPQLVLTASAWWVLVSGTGLVSFPWMLVARWLRESAGMLLPGGGLLGQVAAARLVTRRGLPGDIAAATATVDMTIEMASQVLVTAVGLLLLLHRGVGREMLPAVVAGLAAAAVAVGALIGVQRLSPRSRLGGALRALVQRLPDRWWQAIRDTYAAVRRVHAKRGRLAVALCCHSAGWAFGALEVVGVLALIGRRISLTDGLIVETLAQALRSAAFMLPGALGVQEGAIVGAAALVGVPPASALTLALVRRAREVLTSLPGLPVWQQLRARQ